MHEWNREVSQTASWLLQSLSTSNGYKTNGKLSQHFVIFRFNFTNTNALGSVVDSILQGIQGVLCYYVLHLYMEHLRKQSCSRHLISWFFSWLCTKKISIAISREKKNGRLVVIFSRQTVSTQIQSTIEPYFSLLNKGTNLCFPCWHWQLKKTAKEKE